MPCHSFVERRYCGFITLYFKFAFQKILSNPIKSFLSYQLFCLLVFNVNSHLYAQERIVYGMVRDAQTGLPLVSCSVYSLRSGSGVITDGSGKYSLSIDGKTDSIAISMVGYQSTTRPVTKAAEQEINFSVNPVTTAMQGVVIQFKAKYSLAQKLIKNVIDNKGRNDVFKDNSYQCQVYDKIELDLKNIPKKLESSRLVKPLAFAFKNQDTTADKQIALPVYISESNSDFYYRKKPEKERYDYTGIKSSGIDNRSILKYVDGLYKKINVYDNNIKFVDINYISPISDNALIYYNYQILDTVVFDHHRCIQVQFAPKFFGSNTFRGYLWVADTSFAVKSVVMHIDKNANINFIKKFEISQNFEASDQGKYLPEKNTLYIDLFLPDLKKIGAIVKKTTLFKDAILNNSEIDTAFGKKPIDMTSRPEDTTKWSVKRFEPLSKSENSVYSLMDTLRKIPLAVTYGKIISAISTGYYTSGHVDIGNLYSIYTNNIVEGNRVTFGLKTNYKFNGNIQLRGYAGLSSRDKQFRYLFSSRFVLSRKQWSTLQFTCTSDIKGAYTYENELDQNSIFAAFLRRVPYSQTRLINSKNSDITFQKFFNNGIAIGGQINHNAITPFFDVYYTYDGFEPFLMTKPGVNNDYTINEATVWLRYSHKERYVTQHYTRASLGSNYPIVTLSYTKGIKVNSGFLKSDFNYSKWNLNIQHDFTDGRIGQLSYTINAGFTNGVLPIVLLNVPNGNDTYYNDIYAFNNMNRYEFATDKFISLFVQQSFGNFPFKYVPFLRRVKWRSLVTFKGVLGDMSEANKIANAYYDSTATFHFTIPDRIPYMEAGVGIDNIFHLIRIDGVWRLNYLNNPGVPKFGIKGSLELKF